MEKTKILCTSFLLLAFNATLCAQEDRSWGAEIRSIATASMHENVWAAGQPQDRRVVLYRTSWCGYCKQAAAHMQRRGIAYWERDIERDTAARQDYQRYKVRGVPLLVFGNRSMSGFSPESFDRAYASFIDNQRSQAPQNQADYAQVGHGGGGGGYGGSHPQGGGMYQGGGGGTYQAPAVVAPTVVVGTGYTQGNNVPGFTRTPGGGYDMYAPQQQPVPNTHNTVDDNSNVLESGDVLVGKIKNVPIYAQPSKKSQVVQRLKTGTEIVFSGRESGGFLQVSSDTAEGWVDKLLVTFAP